MGRFIVTSGTHFDPISFEQMGQMITNANQKYEAADDAYSEIASNTEALERYISDNPNDSEAKKMYDSYKNKLTTLQENLWNNGYNAQTRRDLRDARASYAKDMGRLNDVITRRREAAKQYATAMHNNPHLVLGKNPGDAGLNAYLQDDNFGNDWFSYDSSKFETEVGAEVANRMKGLVRGLQDKNSIVKNPALKSTLTRVLTNGATNEEVSEARALAPSLIGYSQSERTRAYNEMKKAGNPVSVVAQIMIDTLADKYQSTGITNSDADDSQKSRLVNRGLAGFSYGIGAPDIKDFNDPDFDLQQAIAEAAANGGLPADGGYPVADVDYDTRNGKDAKKAGKKYSKWFGDIPMIVDGRTKAEIRNGADASAAVYSHDIGEESMRRLGFDVRRSNYGAKASKNFLTGVTVGNDGITYETRYVPSADTVQVRKKGSNIDWKDAPRSQVLTDVAHDLRGKYEANLEWYKKNQRDLYDAATFDVDDMYDIMEEYDLPFSSVHDIRDAYMSDPKNRVGNNMDRTVVASLAGGDSTIENFAKTLLGNITEGSTGAYRRYNGSTMGIHEIGKDGLPVSHAKRDMDKVFDFDDKDTLGVAAVYLTDDGLKNGYLIMHTSKGDFSIGIDMIPSGKIKSEFMHAQQAYAHANGLGADERGAAMFDTKNNFTNGVKSILNYGNKDQELGNTNSKNPYSI